MIWKLLWFFPKISKYFLDSQLESPSQQVPPLIPDFQLVPPEVRQMSAGHWWTSGGSNRTTGIEIWERDLGTERDLENPDIRADKRRQTGLLVFSAALFF